MIRRITGKAARMARAGAYALSIERFFYRDSTDRVIVTYHGVAERARTDLNVRFCSIEDFTRQIRYFKRRFSVVPLEEVFTAPAARRPLLAITFDDGYRNNFLHALPLLEHERVPAAFFVTSIREQGHDVLWADALDLGTLFSPADFKYKHFHFKKNAQGKLFCAEMKTGLTAFTKPLPFDEKMAVVKALLAASGRDFRGEKQLEDYWRLMDDAEIAETSRSTYVRIGSHSQFHNPLGTIPLEQARQELSASKSYLERITGKPVEALAYPNGSYTRAVMDTAAELGYKYQLAEDYAHPEDVSDGRIMDRVGLYADRSWIEQLHQLNSYCSQDR